MISANRQDALEIKETGYENLYTRHEYFLICSIPEIETLKVMRAKTINFEVIIADKDATHTLVEKVMQIL